MMCLLFTLVLVISIGDSWESCRRQMFHADTKMCQLSDGQTLAIGNTLQIPSQCTKCSCSSYGTNGDHMLTCCGYGIYAGVMQGPPGCKVIADTDGCTPKIVQIADETKLC